MRLRSIARPPRLRWLYACVAMCALVGGCSSSAVVTSSQMKGVARSPVAGGVTYYLPKVMLKIGIWEAAEFTVPADRNEPPKLKEARRFATFMERHTIPDRNYLMRLTVHPSASFHDNIQVFMSPEGLLSEVRTTVRDEGPAIVAKLAQLASGIAQAAHAPHAKSTAGPTEDVRMRLLGTVMVDPTDPDSYGPQLLAHGITLTSEPTVAEACCGLLPNAPCEPVSNQSGVCYRPVAPFRVRLWPGGRMVTTRAGTVPEELPEGIEDIFMFPNRSPVVCLPIDRVPFVTSSFRVTFANGLLTSMESDKPSEILAFLEIPITVAKAIVSIPAELLTFKVNHYEKVSQAAAKEQAALQAIEDLSKAKQGGE